MSSRKNGVMHHISPPMPPCVLCMKSSTYLLLLLELSGALLAGLLLGLALLEKGLWDKNLVVGGDASVLRSVLCPAYK